MAATVYADSSFWVSLYVRDAHSERAREVVVDNSPIFLTEIVEHELRNAIRLSVFRKQITKAQSQASLTAFADDQSTRLVENARLVWQNLFERTEALSDRYTAKQGQRATDILHVASALELGAKCFLTFDHRPARLAKAAGLKVVT